MSDAISEMPIKYQLKKTGKKSRKYSFILQHLAKIDNSINKMKVTVSEGKFIEERDHFFIAPSKFNNCFGHLVPHYSNENTKENLNIENNISSSKDIESTDYPDSSDFSDDE